MAIDWRGRTIAEAWSSGRNHFNLIRLVAAWMVIYGHSWAITGTKGGDVFTWLTKFKFGGAIAVDMFFVISGFLIAASLQRNDVRGFLASRALRIYPALIVCIALTVFVMGPLLTTSPDYWRSSMTWEYLWHNATLHRAEFWLPGVFDDLPRTGVNGSLWTLPIEGQLYVLLAIAGVLGFIHPRRYLLPWLFIVLVSARAAWRGWQIPIISVEERWCVLFFITGTALWLYRDRVRLSWMAIVALLALAWATRGTPWFGGVYFVLIAYGTLWLAFVRRGPPATHHDLSYGLYLYGWPAAQLVQIWSPGSPWHNTVWASVLGLTLAALSWVLVERPALRMKRAFGTKTPVASPANAGA